VEDALERCAHVLQKYPIRSNAVVSGILCSLGDVLAQAVEWKLNITSPDKTEFNMMRTARMATFGTFICGPVLSIWYRTLAIASAALQVGYKPVVRGRIASFVEWVAPQWEAQLHLKLERRHSPAAVLVGKVVADSVLFQLPFLNLYFATMGVLEGLSPQAVYQKTQDSFYRAWGIGFLVWAPVQVTTAPKPHAGPHRSRSRTHRSRWRLQPTRAVHPCLVCARRCR